MLMINYDKNYQTNSQILWLGSKNLPILGTQDQGEKLAKLPCFMTSLKTPYDKNIFYTILKIIAVIQTDENVGLFIVLRCVNISISWQIRSIFKCPLCKLVWGETTIGSFHCFCQYIYESPLQNLTRAHFIIKNRMFPKIGGQVLEKLNIQSQYFEYFIGIGYAESDMSPMWDSLNRSIYPIGKERKC